MSEVLPFRRVRHEMYKPINKLLRIVSWEITWVFSGFHEAYTLIGIEKKYDGSIDVTLRPHWITDAMSNQEKRHFSNEKMLLTTLAQYGLHPVKRKNRWETTASGLRVLKLVSASPIKHFLVWIYDLLVFTGLAFVCGLVVWGVWKSYQSSMLGSLDTVILDGWLYPAFWGTLAFLLVIGFGTQSTAEDIRTSRLWVRQRFRWVQGKVVLITFREVYTAPFEGEVEFFQDGRRCIPHTELIEKIKSLESNL